jgi:AcrR family transcriptional regulator
MKTKTQAVRHRILATAAELFYSQGYNLTGINQLIEEAGVAKASLYQNFGSKEEVLEAYLEEVSADWFQTLNERVAMYTSPFEKVHASFDLIAEFMQCHAFRGCNFQNATTEVPDTQDSVRQLIKNHKSRMRLFFTDLLAATPHANKADALSVLYEGALVSSQMQGELWPITSAQALADRMLT